MLKLICAGVGNLPGVPNNLTVWTRKLESVARRVWNKSLMEREPSAASRTADDVENVNALNYDEDDEANKEPRRAGEQRTGNRGDKRDCPNPIWKEHSARQWTSLCHARRRCLTSELSDSRRQGRWSARGASELPPSLERTSGAAVRSSDLVRPRCRHL